MSHLAVLVVCIALIRGSEAAATSRHIRFDSADIDSFLGEQVQELMRRQYCVYLLARGWRLLLIDVAILEESEVRADSLEFLVITRHHCDDFKLAQIDLKTKISIINISYKHALSPRTYISIFCCLHPFPEVKFRKYAADLLR